MNEEPRMILRCNMCEDNTCGGRDLPMLTDDSARSIAALAQEAAVEPSRFAPLLALISDTVGAHGAALFTPALDPEGRQLGVAHAAAAAALPAYAATWAEHDAWLQGLMQQPVPFQPGRCNLG